MTREDVVNWFRSLKSFDTFKELMDYRIEVMLALHKICLSQFGSFAYVYGVKPKLGEDWDLTRDQFLNDVENGFNRFQQIVESKCLESDEYIMVQCPKYKRNVNSFYTEYDSKIYMINGSRMRVAFKGMSIDMIYYSGDPKELCEYYPHYIKGKLPNTYTPIWMK